MRTTLIILAFLIAFCSAELLEKEEDGGDLVARLRTKTKSSLDPAIQSCVNSVVEKYPVLRQQTNACRAPAALGVSTEANCLKKGQQLRQCFP